MPASVSPAPRDHPAARGFTLVEILIVVVIIGTLAAIVIPKFAEANENARYTTIKADLRAMRGQIELFRVHHRGELPDLIGQGWAVMTQPTHADQTVAADGPFGPYLTKTPVNPFNGATSIVTADSATDGWKYDPNTGELWGLMPQNMYDTLFLDDPEIVTYVVPGQ